MNHKIDDIDSDDDLLQDPAQRDITPNQFFNESAKRIAYNFLTTVAQLLMKDFMKLLLLVLILFIASIGAAFYPETWQWKLGTFLFSFAISVTILIVLHQRWLSNIVKRSLKHAVIQEGKLIIKVIQSPEYSNNFEALSTLTSQINIDGIKASATQLSSQTLRSMANSKTVTHILNSANMRDFINEQSRKIIAAARYVIEEQRRTSKEDGKIARDNEAVNSYKDEE